MRTFPNFPEQSKCPICNTNDDKECFLVGIDGTGDGYNEEAEVVHVDCLFGSVESSGNFRINKDHGIIYKFF